MATLRAVDGSKSKAAQVLGISLKTLYNRLHAYGGGARVRAERGNRCRSGSKARRVKQQSANWPIAEEV